VSGVGDRLAEIEHRIAAACERAGRPRASVRLVGASKRQPIGRMRAAYDGGLRHFGENRVQEGQAKRAEMPQDVEWHLLGPLQSNKVRAALDVFTLFHAVDRKKIALALDAEAGARGIRVRGLLEVNVGGEATKHGFEAMTLIDEVAPLADLRHLEIVGLMTLPPPRETPEAARADFRQLVELRDRLNERSEWGRRLTELSMGMSNDFEVAIEEGATFVRIGTSLFGARD